MSFSDLKKIIIVGGGFTGVQTALKLSKKAKNQKIKIELISDKSHFEYHAALYRVVTGKSPLEVCIPLTEIFQGTNVELITDEIKEVDLKNKKLIGTSQSHYSYDYLVLALGSETTFFNIPGVEEYSFGFKSIAEAIRLKRHLHAVCDEIAENNFTSNQGRRIEFVVVGAGASGTELAGELATYLEKVFLHHGLAKELLRIELIDGAPSILPMMSPAFSNKVKERLKKLGIDIKVNNQIIKENVDTLFIKNEEIHTKTVIWTAGITTNRLYKRIYGLEFDRKSRVIVEPTLLVKGFKDVFVGGDAASAPYVGMAQTAIDHSRTIAKNILLSINNFSLESHKPKEPYYAIPVGLGWAGVKIKNYYFYGKIGWFLRRVADFRFFLSILPFGKAIAAFRNGTRVVESCPICSNL